MTNSRALSRLVLQPDWRKEVADRNVTLDSVAAEIADIEGSLPLKKIEPGLRGPHSNALMKALRPFGAKIAPTMNQGEADAWRAAVALALSDLPPHIALYALGKAIHRPMQFPNQVEEIAREYADEALARQRTALHRLKMMKAEIERAANPQPALEAPPMIWTQEKVDEANAAFKRLGLKMRYRLTDEGVENYDVDNATS
jgi:hypothetical protein